jgi:hypothetical protein
MSKRYDHRARAIGEMDPLVARCVAAVEDGRTARLVAWYESAQQLRGVLTGGPDALRACETATGLRASTIRRWSFAATRFAPEEFQHLAQWRDENGSAMSVWHIVELARFSRHARQQALVAMRPGLWPVVKLRCAARSKKVPRCA